MTPPCKGCTERYVGCHGKCEKYAAWQSKHEKAKQRQREELDAIDNRIRGLERMLNPKNRMIGK